LSEEEWLAGTEPHRMGIFLRVRGSERKLRLVKVAECRPFLSKMPNEQCRQAVIAAELFADGLISEGDLIIACRAALNTHDLIMQQDFQGCAFARVAAEAAYLPIRDMSSAPAIYCWDIFGNPFRPISIAPSWLTSTVVALAKGIYNDRAYDRMPILADALQDAGCENADILNHCRGEGVHVRGCWVVDLLLGKE
jgi:hypothetical protein